MDSPAGRPLNDSSHLDSQSPLTAEAVLPRLRSVLDPLRDVDFAYLFGSVAKGRARASSDIDVAIHFPYPGKTAEDRLRIVDRALDIEALLERELRPPVQLVALNTAPIGLTHNVLQHGVLVYSANETVRRSFYLEHARLYYDFEHARRIFARYMSRRIESGTFGG